MFAQDQLDGTLGRGKLLQETTYRVLQTPIADNFALGWGVELGSDGTPAFLTHAGSNGYCWAVIRVYPKQDTLMLMVTNFGNAIAEKSISDLGDGLAEHLRLRN